MNYTLDSVKHAKECLKQSNKGRDIIDLPIIKNVSEILDNPDKEIFYFGVVTIGENTPTNETDLVNFYDENDTKIISVLPNNQIVLLFNRMTSVNANLSGQFRGFELTLK